MGLFDDSFDPNQFQDSGGLFGRLLSMRPDLDFSSLSGGGAQDPFGGSIGLPASLLSPALQVAPIGATDLALSNPPVAPPAAAPQNAPASGAVSQPGKSAGSQQ